MEKETDPIRRLEAERSYTKDNESSYLSFYSAATAS